MSRRRKSQQSKNATRPPLTLRKKILFSALTVLAVFAALELGLRLARIGAPPVVGSLRFGYDTGIPIYDSDGILREGEPYRDVPLFEADPVLFWKPIANTPFTGIDGLRLETPQSSLKQEGVYRIGVIGDSCSFLGEKLYPNRFGELIREQEERQVEVINASCPGYTSFQGAGRLADLWRWQPDVVVVYFGWNDHWKSLNGQTDRQLAERQLLSDKARSWLGMSRIYWCMYTFRTKLAPLTSPNRAPVRVTLEDYRENLEAILHSAEEHGCQTLFITAPSAFLEGQLPTWAYSFFGQIYRMSPQEVSEIPATHSRYNDVVRQVAASNANAVLVDVAAEWSTPAEIEKHPERFRGDRIHLKEAGHQAIADQLYRQWSEASTSPAP
jgi:lysophospholipase L1-like esterase